MHSIRLEEITETDIDRLVENAVVERKQQEYKRELPATTGDAKKEFLADVSSFANTEGGDLIFGVEEKDGTPVAVPGVSVPNEDQEMLRWETLIRDGIAPRIRCESCFVPRTGKPPVYIIRVDRSWNPPHRVEFGGHHKFYGRGTNGKFQMDVEQLRASFTFSTTVADRIRAFRSERLEKIRTDKTHLKLRGDSRLILHLIPFGSVASPAPSYQLLKISRQPTQLPPMCLGLSGWCGRINLDGFLTFDGNNWSSETYRYTQLYRSGIVESVESFILTLTDPNGERRLPANGIEEMLFQHVPAMLKIQTELGVVPPIALALTLTNTKGLAIPDWMGMIENPMVDDELILPEVVINEFSTKLDGIIRPLADLIWNAGGKEGSPNFNAEGKWSRPKR